MKISIITTVYKAEKELPRLLDSMMAQKSPELEFFLIDNGSPDRCGEICREYAKKDSRFTVHTLKENIGYIRARNVGIEACDSDYVGFCDSDDYLEPGGYDRAVQVIRDTDCDFYATAYHTVGGGSRTTILPFVAGLYTGAQIEEKILPQIFGPLPGRGMLHGFMWKHIIRRSIVVDHNIRFFEPLKPYEDQLFNIDVVKHSSRVYIDDQVIYNYIVNEQSITAQLAKNFDAEGEWKRIKELYYQKCSRSYNDTQYSALCNQALTSLYAMILNMVKCTALPLTDAVCLLRKFAAEDMICAVCSHASAQQSSTLSFVRWCLPHKCYGMLLNVISVSLKLRQSLHK